MKLTNKQLKKIIQEELKKSLKEYGMGYDIPGDGLEAGPHTVFAFKKGTKFHSGMAHEFDQPFPLSRGDGFLGYFELYEKDDYDRLMQLIKAEGSNLVLLEEDPNESFNDYKSSRMLSFDQISQMEGKPVEEFAYNIPLRELVVSAMNFHGGDAGTFDVLDKPKPQPTQMKLPFMKNLK